MAPGRSTNRLFPTVTDLGRSAGRTSDVRGILRWLQRDACGSGLVPEPRNPERGPTGGVRGAGSISDRAVEDDLHMPLVTQDGLEVGRPGGAVEPPGAAGEFVGPHGG